MGERRELLTRATQHHKDAHEEQPAAITASQQSGLLGQGQAGKGRTGLGRLEWAPGVGREGDSLCHRILGSLPGQEASLILCHWLRSAWGKEANAAFPHGEFGGGLSTHRIQ